MQGISYAFILTIAWCFVQVTETLHMRVLSEVYEESEHTAATSGECMFS